MLTLTTPKGLRLHIAFFGRRNVGKSSLLNALTHQQVSIVSPVAGTTTDPVEKPMELLPLGPVLLIDTAGIDDSGELGPLRVQKTRQVLDRTDLAVLVVGAGGWSVWEEDLLAELRSRKLPVIVVFNQIDLGQPPPTLPTRLAHDGVACVKTSVPQRLGLADLREALLHTVPPEFLHPPPLLGDLVGPGELAVLVTPIDKEAPKGRLILPQVQAIRDLLDHQACCVVTTEPTLGAVLRQLKSPPQLVVTDSQAFQSVAAVVPPHVPLTGFSILMARCKGDLTAQVQGVLAIDRLVPGDQILIAETCSHHPIEDDIGRVKLPRWLNESVGGPLRFQHVRGHDFPEDLTPYRLVVHCGACMWNRREMLNRILRCQAAGVPLTNYGLTIAHHLGILERALAPFPAALEVYRQSRQQGQAA